MTHQVFICGPKDADAYSVAASRIASAGYVPVNPLFVLAKNGHAQDYAQREALVILVRQGTAMALLDGWADDPEARLEHALAIGLGYVVADLDDWVSPGTPEPALSHQVEALDDLASLVIATPAEPPDFDGTHRAQATRDGQHRCTCSKLYESEDVLARHIETANGVTS